MEYSTEELDRIIADELEARRRPAPPAPRRDWDRRLRPRKPLDPAKCLGCRKRHPDLKPVYGKKLPGACPACWPAVRAKALEFAGAWRLHIALGAQPERAAAVAAGGAGL